MKLLFQLIAISFAGVFALDKPKTRLKIQESLKNARNTGHTRLGSQHNRKLADTPCFPDFSFFTELGCTIRGAFDFIEALADALDEENCEHGPIEELMAAIGTDQEDDVFDALGDQCDEFWSSQEFESLTRVGDGTDVFLKEFFDGGTYWNEARETTYDNGERVNVLAVDPGRKIKRFQSTVASSGGIEFPEQLVNFEDCEVRAAMCCWVQDRQAGDDNGNCEEPYDENCVNEDPMDNVDICAVDMGRSPESNRVEGGTVFFPGEQEGDAHCHGFAWGNSEFDANTIFRGNNLFFISAFDHLVKRGYVKNVPGAPMCACVEQMPIVSRADCTEIDLVQGTMFEYSAGEIIVSPEEEYDVEFFACEGIDGNDNDLESYYERLVEEENAEPEELAILQETIVGEDGCNGYLRELMDNLN